MGPAALVRPISFVRGLALRIKSRLDGPRIVRVPDPAPSATWRTGLQLDLSGRVALVTGASGELGRSIARTLSACGASVAVHYFRGADKAEVVRRELEDLGAPSCTVQADVCSEASVYAMRDQISQRLGPVEIVVHNAIEWYPDAHIQTQSLEAFDRMYRSSVHQIILCAKAFVPGMIERQRGRIIGISSEVAIQALPGKAAYTAAKRSMDGVLRTLAHEVGFHQITVNQIAPGWMISDRDRRDGTQEAPHYSVRVPLARRGYDQDVAHAVAFLASDLAMFITGAYLPVCGGNVMPGI